MSLSVLAQGTLTSDPMERTSNAGKPFVTTQLRVATEDESMLVSVICFDAAACEKLARLRKGDEVSVTSRAKPTAWEKNGEQRHGLSLVASGVLTAYEATKRRGKPQTHPADPETLWQPPESSLEALQ